MKKTVSVLAGFIALPASLLSTHAAGFTGDFAVTPPVAGLYSISQSFGNWTGDISQGGSISTVASIDTSNAPNSITLSAAPPELPPLPGPTGRNGSLQGFAIEIPISFAQLTINAPTAGTFSLSYSLDLGSSTASYLDDGIWTPFDTGSSTLNLILDAGELFGFRVENQTFLNVIDLNARGAALANGVTDSLTIRNPSFEPVPEASTVAAGLALAGLAGWSCFRARRRA